MPCYQVRTTILAFEVANREMLAKAIANVEGFTDVVQMSDRIGFRYHGNPGTWRDGRITMRGEMTIDQNALRRAYSKETIKATAKAKGWQVRFQKDTAHVVRRRFA